MDRRARESAGARRPLDLLGLPSLVGDRTLALDVSDRRWPLVRSRILSTHDCRTPRGARRAGVRDSRHPRAASRGAGWCGVAQAKSSAERTGRRRVSRRQARMLVHLPAGGGEPRPAQAGDARRCRPGDRPGRTRPALHRGRVDGGLDWRLCLDPGCPVREDAPADSDARAIDQHAWKRHCCWSSARGPYLDWLSAASFARGTCWLAGAPT